MTLVVDANLITPEFVTDEIENYQALILEKSGMRPGRVTQFIELLFQYIEIVPASEFYPHIPDAEAALGEIDPDDVLYLACALAADAEIWSDDADFAAQDLVPTPYNGRRDCTVRNAVIGRRPTLRTRISVRSSGPSR